MGKGSKSGGACKSLAHREMKERAKNRVDDLQGMFSYLQTARKESRPMMEVAVLEEQVHQMLKEWKSELNQPSPASSLQAGNLGSFSSEIYRLLHLGEEEDDATSALAVSKPEPDAQEVTNETSLLEGFNANQGPQRQEFQFTDYCKPSISAGQNLDANVLLYPSHLEYHHLYDLHQEVEQNYSGFVGPLMYGEDALDRVYGYLPNMCPPPSAFLGPKCSLWDCTRPAQGFDYCSSHHAALALKEGPPGMTPVLRPGGIVLKDGLLFAVLNAKAQGKDVGVPECEGAATAKSPWNAPELFDLTVLERETIREWLFFDKPRRAFESGNRKQRSLPDYNGRGWHESRKQVMNDFGGLKRSYYMDPQPRKDFEWHLYEYEINNFDACALYRLEFKRADGKKSTKGKSPSDSVADLQKQMGRLTAEFPTSKRSVKGRAIAASNDRVENTYSDPNRVGPGNEGFEHGVGAVNDYLVTDLNGYYLT